MQGIQTRLRPTDEQAFWLKDLAERWNTVCRQGYQRLARGALAPEDLRRWLMDEGLTDHQAKSAGSQINTWRTMGAGTRTHRQTQLAQTVQGLEEHLGTLLQEEQAWATHAADPLKTPAERKEARQQVERLRALRFQKRRRQDRLARDLVSVAAQDPMIGQPMVFGGRRLLDQRARVGAPDSPYATVADWRHAWERSRNGGLTLVGAGAQSFGNQSAQLNLADGTLTLRLTEPQAQARLAAEADRLGKPIERVPGKLRFKRLTLEGVAFAPHEAERLRQAQALGLPITVTVSQKLTPRGKRHRRQRQALEAKDVG